MADLGRWFKLWCSAADDPALDNLSVADFGRYCKLGIVIKEHGTDGRIRVISPAKTLCAKFQVSDFDALIDAIRRLPGVSVRRSKASVSLETIGSVSFLVSFDNWLKYQGDYSTHRVRNWRAEHRSVKRSKRRREETRREERRGEENATTFVDSVGYSLPPNGRSPSPAAVIQGGSDALERKPGTPVPKPASRRRRRYSAGRVLPTIPAWVRPVFEAWELAYRERFGKPPGEPKPWDIAAAEVLVEKYGVDDVVAIVTRGIRTGPRCLRDRHKWGLQAIEDSWDTLVSLKASGQLL